MSRRAKRGLKPTITTMSEPGYGHYPFVAHAAMMFGLPLLVKTDPKGQRGATPFAGQGGPSFVEGAASGSGLALIRCAQCPIRSLPASISAPTSRASSGCGLAL